MLEEHKAEAALWKKFMPVVMKKDGDLCHKLAVSKNKMPCSLPTVLLRLNEKKASEKRVKKSQVW